MELRNRVCIITGAASGIGRAGALKFASEGAKVVAADRDANGVAETVAMITEQGQQAIAVTCDVSKEQDIVAMIDAAEKMFGPVDLVWSNAGIGFAGGVETSDEQWQSIWDINLMAHVWTARAILPKMIERGEGYLVSTASAAGLLSNLGTASYTVTKHAAVALAEWLSITHGSQGIRVSCLCPQGVNTNMLNGPSLDGDPVAAASVKAAGDVLEPEVVAQCVVDAIRAETFLILPHPEVLTFWQRKSTDIDRWLGGMRRLQAKVRSNGAS
jgi:NAD(P)-dependent dehydrogenase (short-subunit alcohol dehydrogenase family)